MKPRHTAEQSTVSVNKGESIGKSGFSSLRSRINNVNAQETESVVEIPSDFMTENIPGVPETEDSVSTQTKANLKVHLAEDPQDALLCEGCQ